MWDVNKLLLFQDIKKCYSTCLEAFKICLTIVYLSILFISFKKLLEQAHFEKCTPVGYFKLLREIFFTWFTYPEWGIWLKWLKVIYTRMNNCWIQGRYDLGCIKANELMLGGLQWRHSTDCKLSNPIAFKVLSKHWLLIVGFIRNCFLRNKRHILGFVGCLVRYALILS